MATEKSGKLDTKDTNNTNTKNKQETVKTPSTPADTNTMPPKKDKKKQPEKRNSSLMKAAAAIKGVDKISTFFATGGGHETTNKTTEGGAPSLGTTTIDTNNREEFPPLEGLTTRKTKTPNAITPGDTGKPDKFSPFATKDGKKNEAGSDTKNSGNSNKDAGKKRTSTGGTTDDNEIQRVLDYVEGNPGGRSLSIAMGDNNSKVTSSSKRGAVVAAQANTGGTAAAQGDNNSIVVARAAEGGTAEAEGNRKSTVVATATRDTAKAKGDNGSVVQANAGEAKVTKQSKRDKKQQKNKQKKNTGSKETNTAHPKGGIPPTVNFAQTQNPPPTGENKESTNKNDESSTDEAMENAKEVAPDPDAHLDGMTQEAMKDQRADPSRYYTFVAEAGTTAAFNNMIAKRSPPTRDGYTPDERFISSNTGPEQTMKDLTEIMKDNLDPDEDLGAAMTNPKKWSACIKLGIKPIHHPIKNSKSNLSPEKRETLLNAAFIWTRTPPEYFHPKDVEILETTIEKTHYKTFKQPDTAFWTACQSLFGQAHQVPMNLNFRNSRPKKKKLSKGGKPRAFVYRHTSQDEEGEKIAHMQKEHEQEMEKNKHPPTQYQSYMELRTYAGTKEDISSTEYPDWTNLGTELKTFIAAVHATDLGAYVAAFPKDGIHDRKPPLTSDYMNSGTKWQKTGWNIRSYFEGLFPPALNGTRYGRVLIGHNVVPDQFYKTLQHNLGDAEDPTTFTAWPAKLQSAIVLDIAWLLRSTPKDENHRETMAATREKIASLGYLEEAIPPFNMLTKTIRTHSAENAGTAYKDRPKPVYATFFQVGNEDFHVFKDMLEETFPTKRRLHGQVLGSQSSIVFTTICPMNDCGPEARANQATLRAKQGEYLSERSTTTFPDIQLADTPAYRNGPTFREIMLKLKHPFKPNTPLLNGFHRDIFNPRTFKAIHNIDDSSLVVELRAMLPHIIRRDMPHLQDSTYKWLSHAYWENADKRYPQDPHDRDTRWESSDVINSCKTLWKEKITPTDDTQRTSAQLVTIEWDARKLCNLDGISNEFSIADSAMRSLLGNFSIGTELPDEDNNSKAAPSTAESEITDTGLEITDDNPIALPPNERETTRAAAPQAHEIRPGPKLKMTNSHSLPKHLLQTLTRTPQHPWRLKRTTIMSRPHPPPKSYPRTRTLHPHSPTKARKIQWPTKRPF